jgi:hypothetical protein
VDILMGLDNSRWLPHQANNEGKPPSNFRLMKSKFGGRYMIMGSDTGMRRPKKIERPAREALERVRRGWVALTLLLIAASSGEAQEICGAESGGTPGAGVDSAGRGNHHGYEGLSDPRITALWWALGLAITTTALLLTSKSLMTGLWSTLCYIILLPVKFMQTRRDKQRDSGYGAGNSQLPNIAFADWPPALRRARVELEKRYRAFLADNEREKREYMKGIQAGTRLPPDDERERNMQFWDLWTPEEKEAQRERERLRDSWCPKRPTATPQEGWGNQVSAKLQLLFDDRGSPAAESRSWKCITASRSIFHQLLAATRRRRKITKPLTLSVCAHFNQPSNFERMRPFQLTKQL